MSLLSPPVTSVYHNNGTEKGIKGVDDYDAKDNRVVSSDTITKGDRHNDRKNSMSKAETLASMIYLIRDGPTISESLPQHEEAAITKKENNRLVSSSSSSSTASSCSRSSSSDYTDDDDDEDDGDKYTTTAGGNDTKRDVVPSSGANNNDDIKKDDDDDDEDVCSISECDSDTLELMDDIDIEELLLEDVDDPVWVRQKDKRSFFIGVCDFAFTSMLIAGAPSIYPIYYTIKFIVLMPLRFITYYKRKWQFYMLDFCYFGNVLVIYYYWFMPYSYTLFMITYALVTGPLAWAVLVFRNSLVFHSVDKITSCFIHLGPLFMVTLLRWRTDEMRTNFTSSSSSSTLNHFLYQHTPSSFAVTPTTTSSSSSLCMLLIVIPILVYFIHLLLYGIVTNYVFHVQGDNSQYATSYSHLVSLHGKFLKRCSKYVTDDNMWLWYGIAQIVLTSATILPSFIWYGISKWVNYSLCAACFMAAVWNGANFYVEVFARKHLRSLQREQRNKRKMMNIGIGQACNKWYFMRG
ncbi:hypothetical protein FOZ60_016886 [Perkinsus olseni]|uniref:Glycerophosphocholine acyltransferase 1 n=1 Tax=Perkinsus olseni TaxID=32597 RepID=A0A7J6N310_PEROL|nr:hypothetical protein FOZ60_016886 [Perkinsus olseni]